MAFQWPCNGLINMKPLQQLHGQHNLLLVSNKLKFELVVYFGLINWPKNGVNIQLQKSCGSYQFYANQV